MARHATIYHNPACGTSRNVLAALREAGVEPEVIEYLKSPPDRATLEGLLKKLGKPVRDILRKRGTPYEELGLDNPALSDDQLFAARPVLGHGDYRMPVRGLYLCGAGAHPGGGVTGIPGRNAAREIVKDARRRAHQ